MKYLNLTFEEWKRLLREDCEREGKRQAFDNLEDYCLNLLWKSEIEPSVKAIVGVPKRAA